MSYPGLRRSRVSRRGGIGPPASGEAPPRPAAAEVSLGSDPGEPAPGAASLARLLEIPGLAESQLDEPTAAALPASSAPAPWTARISALVWWQRSLRGGAAHLPSRPAGTGLLPVTICALIRYLETPVGPYSELLVSPGLVLDGPIPAASIPFIAVDSIASVHAGRSNWGLPKVVACFDWDHGGDRSVPADGADRLGPADGIDQELRAEGADQRSRAAGPRAGAQIRVEGGDSAEGAGPWSLDVRASVRRRSVPFALGIRNRQFRADDSSLVTRIGAFGRARLARVEVDVQGPALPEVIAAGSHSAVLIEPASVAIGPARERGGGTLAPGDADGLLSRLTSSDRGTE